MNSPDVPRIVKAKVEHIFLSPGHNFFGHHGQAAGDHPRVEVDQVNCVAGRGLEGDRFFDHKPDYSGQITFFAMEVYEDLCQTLGIFDRTPAALRRNVFLRGADLNVLIGVTFSLQGLAFAGTKECSPCYWMDQSFGPGAEAFLQGRGGLRARILTSGVLRRERVGALV